MIKTLATVTFLAMFATCQPVSALGPVPCRALQDWNEVPVAARASLESIVGAVAAKGQDFNATDVVRDGLASNRFLGACQRTGLVAVALERGGRAYRIEVFHYTSGKIVRQWTQLLRANGTTSFNLLELPHGR
jgi:hypothetical protein